MPIENTRKLTSIDQGQDNTLYTIVHLEVIPSREEIQKFKTHPEREVEERNLYQITSTVTNFPLNSHTAAEDVLVNGIEKKLDKILQRQDGILTKPIDEKQLEKIIQCQDGIMTNLINEMELKKFLQRQDETLVMSIDEKKLEKILQHQNNEVDKMFFFSCVLMVTSVIISIVVAFHVRK